MSIRAWLLLKLIPAFSAPFRNVTQLDQTIRKNRAVGPALPPRRARQRFTISDERWGDTRVLRLADRSDPAVLQRLLYLHGGAFIFHIQAGQWALPIELLGRLRGAVVTPFYPLAPEQDWRAGIAAARRVYLGLVDECGAHNVVVIGDSAGGGLALSLAQVLRDAGEPLPAALVLFSPWLDLAVKGDDQPAIQRIDPALSIEVLRAAGRLWAHDAAVDDPRVSPLFAAQHGLPPTIVFSGTRDILDSDAVRLAAINPAITLQRYPGMFHVWAAAPIPEGRRALDQAAAFICTATAVNCGGGGSHQRNNRDLP